MAKRRTAFTLVEILVVLAIIGILAALLFPSFSSARERGRQTTCASNLKQLGLAVAQYYSDERRYPEFLRDLLPNDAKIAVGSPTDPVPTGQADNTGGTGYFSGGSGALNCLSDDTDIAGPRSSYGNLTFGLGLDPEAGRDGFISPAPTTADPGRYVWNFWGYNNQGVAYQNAAQVLADGVPSPSLVTPTGAFYHRTLGGSGTDNVMKYSMSNRFAPPQTIVTHCVFHRTWTAANADFPGEIYEDAARGLGARDIVLRKDGSAKLMDVSSWNGSNSEWQMPKF